ncbi:MAG TPA: hypothetical protein ENK57_21190, partial [Polyangiaceae bacterium]|nr:hypothetical protein [Polyangiaceae bacterium]
MTSLTRSLAIAALAWVLVGCGGDPNAAWDPPATPASQTAGPGDEGGEAAPPTSMEGAMRQVPVTMYMTTWCPVCRRARGWLQSGGYSF